MPRRIPVQRLSELTLEVISTEISELLNDHNAGKCEYCKLIWLNENCYALQQKKKSIEDCPETVRIQIYQKLVPDAYFQRLLSIRKKDQQYVTRYFQVWLCSCSSLRICYDSIRENLEDFHFLGKFGKLVGTLMYSKEMPTFDYVSFGSTINSAPNLQKLSFHYPGVLMGDRILELIGKCCHNICELRGYIIKRTNNFENAQGDTFWDTRLVSGYAKLIFKDFETKQHPNPCCRTLQVLNLHNIGSSESFKTQLSAKSETELKEFLLMLNKYLPNIKSFGLRIPLDEMISYFDTETKIELGTIQILNIEQVEKIQRLFPKLRELHYNISKNINSNVHVLRKFQKINLTTLKLHFGYMRSDHQIYNGILFNNWSSLKHLTISSDSSFRSLNKLDISKFAKKLASLEVLQISSTRKIIWDKSSCFRNLKTISIKMITTKRNDSSWFPSFAATIKSIKVKYFLGSIGVEDTAEIFTTSYPFLEDMDVYKLTCENADLLKCFVNSCPNLRSIGEFVAHEEINEEELNNYFKENNIDCVVNPPAPSLFS